MLFGGLDGDAYSDDLVVFYCDNDCQDTNNDEEYMPCCVRVSRCARFRQGDGGLGLRMYLGAKKNLFQSNRTYSVSSGGPLSLFFFCFCCDGSIMPDISMSLSRLRNHMAAA